MKANKQVAGLPELLYWEEDSARSKRFKYKKAPNKLKYKRKVACSYRLF
jgi:hypothetical protein